MKSLVLKTKWIGQLLRFLVVGLLNTAVDFLTLNLLILIFGLSQGGLRFPIFKGISFLVAVINSYLWSKYFVFRRSSLSTESEKNHREAVIFFLVSLIGFLLNVSIASLSYANFFVSFLGPWFSANLGALVGTLVVLVWNFLGYKFLVFRI